MFNKIFIQNVEVHNHFTRQQNKLHVSKATNAPVGKTIQYKGIYFWNLSPKLKTNLSLFTFKNSLKQYLMVNEVFL